MPELPEVETVRRGLDAALKGRTVAHVQLMRPDLRRPFPEGFAARLAGRRIQGVERRAKYLLFRLEGGMVLLAHLGMSGCFSVRHEPPEKPGRHDHVLFIFTDGGALVFTDPRRFGLMDLLTVQALARHPLLAHLGPEPLEKPFSAAYLKAQLVRRSGPVKTALMDQRLVVGVGNIYASEALFAAGIDPRLPACEAAASAGKLAAAIRAVLRAAIASGGSSLRDFLQADGRPGYFQHRFRVYGREGNPCFSCGSTILSLRQAGRSTFCCPVCQERAQHSSGSMRNPRKSAALSKIKKSALGA